MAEPSSVQGQELNYSFEPLQDGLSRSNSFHFKSITSRGNSFVDQQVPPSITNPLQNINFNLINGIPREELFENNFKLKEQIIHLCRECILNPPSNHSSMASLVTPIEISSPSSSFKRQHSAGLIDLDARIINTPPMSPPVHLSTTEGTPSKTPSLRRKSDKYLNVHNMSTTKRKSLHNPSNMNQQLLFDSPSNSSRYLRTNLQAEPSSTLANSAGTPSLKQIISSINQQSSSKVSLWSNVMQTLQSQSHLQTNKVDPNFLLLQSLLEEVTERKISILVDELWDTSRDCSLLQLACSNNSYEIARLLLQFGAKPQTTNKFDSNAFHYAANNGSKEALMVLLEHCDMFFSQTAMQNAKNMKDFYGYTPLMRAVTGQHYECVEILLRARADPNVKMRGGNGQRALHFAIDNFDLRMCQLLVEEGNVKVGAFDDENRTPLMKSVSLLCTEGGPEQEEPKLVVSPRTPRNGLALPVVTREDKYMKQMKLWKYLIQRDMKHVITCKDVFQKNILHYCATAGNSVFLRLLSESFLHDQILKLMHEKDHTGNTPLHTAVQQGHRDCITFLVSLCTENGVCSLYNITNNFKNTPLHIALIRTATAPNKNKLINHSHSIADLKGSVNEIVDEELAQHKKQYMEICQILYATAKKDVTFLKQTNQDNLSIRSLIVANAPQLLKTDDSDDESSSTGEEKSSSKKKKNWRKSLGKALQGVFKNGAKKREGSNIPSTNFTVEEN